MDIRVWSFSWKNDRNDEEWWRMMDTQQPRTWGMMKNILSSNIYLTLSNKWYQGVQNIENNKEQPGTAEWQTNGGPEVQNMENDRGRPNQHMNTSQTCNIDARSYSTHWWWFRAW
jgi:hypothetical protein